MAGEVTVYFFYQITFRITTLNFTEALTNHSSTEYLVLYNVTSLLVSHCKTSICLNVYTVFRTYYNSIIIVRPIFVSMTAVTRNNASDYRTNGLSDYKQL